MVGNAEFYFPMPGAGKDRSFRVSAFFDAGYVWGEDEQPLGSDSFVEQDVRFDDLRYSTGLAFSWSSPIGPLKFSFGHPLNKKDNDEIQRFQFQLGSVF